MRNQNFDEKPKFRCGTRIGYFINNWSSISNSVLQTAEANESMAGPKPKHRLSVYYGTGCPHSQKFFKEQLISPTRLLGEEFELRLNPWGKSQVKNSRIIYQQYVLSEHRWQNALTRSTNSNANMGTASANHRFFTLAPFANTSQSTVQVRRRQCA